jgi:acetylornithine deacetylase
VTRHVSKRDEGVDAVAAAATLVPRIDAMTFSGAANAEHLAVNRAHVGVGGRYNTMPDERVDVPDYLDMIRIYMLAMLDVCEVA